MDENIQRIRLQSDGKGSFWCDIPVSREQWRELLCDRSFITQQWRTVLLAFYFMPGRRATCTECAARYGRYVNTYNSAVSSFGRAVIRKLGNFIIIDDGGEQRYWPVAMERGRSVKTDGTVLFEWQLRKELAEALETIVIEDAVARFSAEIDRYWDDEKYKFQAVKWFRDHWNPADSDFASMLDLSLSKTANLLASVNSFPRGMIVQLAKVAPDNVRDMFTRLYDESLDLRVRVESFIAEAERLRKKHNPGDWNMHYQTTNTVSTYLWLRYPDKYYIYKYSEYRTVADKLGINVVFKKNGRFDEVEKGFRMYDTLNRVLSDDSACVSAIRRYLAADDSLYADPALRTATIGFGFWVSRWFTSAEKSLHHTIPVNMTPFISHASAVLKNKKNIILQGAPGTGKTYNTAALALAIIDGTVPDRHDEVMARYEALRQERRIGFTTFHQSMDYEDFIEGIKPEHDGATVRYKIEDGIFKRMCEAARVASEVAASASDTLLDGLNDNPTVWKVSLESTGDNPTRRDCMDNGHIRIGWADYGDLDFAEDNPGVTEGRNILRTFQYDMKIGDIVVSCWSQDETDAIGIITGDYEFRPEGGKLPRYRTVRWIVKGIRHNIREINNGKRMTLGTVYRLSIALRDILGIIDTYAPAKNITADKAERPYVLIIDEINRGNISKIFGELITLIEKDKRLGDTHPVTLSLPYSKQPDFGVPQNLYIIGTMNTTDRSTGTIDYAIRRRFAFLTIRADRDIIADETGRRLFDDVRRFIESHKYADIDIDDLMVGHSYFMADNNDGLMMKIRYEVIPLIKEYITDGILSVRHEEARRYFDAWQKLESADDTFEGTSED